MAWTIYGFIVCTLSGSGSDGLLDISDGTGNVTVDTSLFNNSDLAMMINSYSTSPDPNNPNGEILNGHELDHLCPRHEYACHTS